MTRSPLTAALMPYFQRKPVGGGAGLSPSYVPVPGLPSRTIAPESVAGGAAHPLHPAAIVDRADIVLARERVVSHGKAVRHGAVGGLPGLTHPHRGKGIELAEFVRGVPAARQEPHSSSSVKTSDARPRAESDVLQIEPAPVLAPLESVVPGNTARVSITLENEGAHRAHLVFFNSGLIGGDGGHIPAERVTFDPQEITIEAGKTGVVTVSVVVPESTLGGVYSGLIRASKHDHLHAVLVVQVEAP